MRSALSPRYAPVNDSTLLEALHESLVRTGHDSDMSVRAISVGPHTLLRLTVPSDGLEARVGDVVEYGIDVGNSELGLRSVQVTPINYRLLCTNGMRAGYTGAGMRMRHVGDARRLEERLREAIPAALEQAQTHIDYWRRATDRRVPDVDVALNSLRRLGMSRPDIEGVRAQLFGAHDDDAAHDGSNDAVAIGEVSVFEFANAITASARLRGSVPARLAGEEVGYRYLVREAA